MTRFSNFDKFDIYWKSSEDMSDISNNSVQSVITSPPYWNLKDYGHNEQIGKSDESYDRYLDRLEQVLAECYSRLRDNGTMWIVVDAFMKRGDLQLLPWHVIQHARQQGFLLQNVVVWYKPTAIAGINNRTVVNKKELVIFLSKYEEYKFRANTSDADGEEDTAVSNHDLLSNVWRHPIKRGSLGKKNPLHKAPYPLSLAERLVRVSTDPGDTILDPFLGSGTTAYAALSGRRRCIGYEINREFESMVIERLSELHQKTLSAEYSKS